MHSHLPHAQPVEAAVALWLPYATQLEDATKTALKQGPKQQPRDPQEAARRRPTKVVHSPQAKLDRLLDAYTDGVLDLAEYKRGAPASRMKLVMPKAVSRS